MYSIFVVYERLWREQNFHEKEVYQRYCRDLQQLIVSAADQDSQSFCFYVKSLCSLILRHEASFLAIFPKQPIEDLVTELKELTPFNILDYLNIQPIFTKNYSIIEITLELQQKSENLFRKLRLEELSRNKDLGIREAIPIDKLKRFIVSLPTGPCRFSLSQIEMNQLIEKASIENSREFSIHFYQLLTSPIDPCLTEDQKQFLLLYIDQNYLRQNAESLKNLNAVIKEIEANKKFELIEKLNECIIETHSPSAEGLLSIILNGDIDSLERILKRFSELIYNETIIKVADHQITYPSLLHVACALLGRVNFIEDEAILKILMKYGADISLRDINNNLPIHFIFTPFNYLSQGKTHIKRALEISFLKELFKKSNVAKEDLTLFLKNWLTQDYSQENTREVLRFLIYTIENGFQDKEEQDYKNSSPILIKEKLFFNNILGELLREGKLKEFKILLSTLKIDSLWPILSYSIYVINAHLKEQCRPFSKFYNSNAIQNGSYLIGLLKNHQELLSSTLLNWDLMDESVNSYVILLLDNYPKNLVFAFLDKLYKENMHQPILFFNLINDTTQGKSILIKFINDFPLLLNELLVDLDLSKCQEFLLTQAISAGAINLFKTVWLKVAQSLQPQLIEYLLCLALKTNQQDVIKFLFNNCKFDSKQEFKVLKPLYYRSSLLFPWEKFNENSIKRAFEVAFELGAVSTLEILIKDHKVFSYFSPGELIFYLNSAIQKNINQKNTAALDCAKWLLKNYECFREKKNILIKMLLKYCNKDHENYGLIILELYNAGINAFSVYNHQFNPNSDSKTLKDILFRQAQLYAQDIISNLLCGDFKEANDLFNKYFLFPKNKQYLNLSLELKSEFEWILGLACYYDQPSLIEGILQYKIDPNISLMPACSLNNYYLNYHTLAKHNYWVGKPLIEIAANNHSYSAMKILISKDVKLNCFEKIDAPLVDTPQSLATNSMIDKILTERYLAYQKAIRDDNHEVLAALFKKYSQSSLIIPARIRKFLDHNEDLFTVALFFQRIKIIKFFIKAGHKLNSNNIIYIDKLNSPEIFILLASRQPEIFNAKSENIQFCIYKQLLELIGKHQSLDACKQILDNTVNSKPIQKYIIYYLNHLTQQASSIKNIYYSDCSLISCIQAIYKALPPIENRYFYKKILLTLIDEALNGDSFPDVLIERKNSFIKKLEEITPHFVDLPGFKFINAHLEVLKNMSFPTHWPNLLLKDSLWRARDYHLSQLVYNNYQDLDEIFTKKTETLQAINQTMIEEIKKIETSLKNVSQKIANDLKSSSASLPTPKMGDNKNGIFTSLSSTNSDNNPTLPIQNGNNFFPF